MEARIERVDAFGLTRDLNGFRQRMPIVDRQHERVTLLRCHVGRDGRERCRIFRHREQYDEAEQVARSREYVISSIAGFTPSAAHERQGVLDLPPGIVGIAEDK